MKSRCGYVAIVGRPNVGKSTLLNHILGQKITITSAKPQTTRHQILGVKTEEEVQAIYVDTPGIHQNEKNKMKRYMNRAALSTLLDVDLILLMIDARSWTDEDEWVLSQLQEIKVPVILALNKIDLVKDKRKLLPQLQRLSEKRNFLKMIPISVEKEINIDQLEEAVKSHLPENPWFFPEDQVTDRGERFLMAEIIREKLMRLTGDEIPYGTTVSIDSVKVEEKIIKIYAMILVERAGQKKIVVGDNGERLKRVGQQARMDLEKMLGNKVYLNLWVKVKSGWSENDKMLKQLGYQ